MKRNSKTNIIVMALIITVMAAGFIFSASAQEDTAVVELPFVNHVAAGMAEQDVFFEDATGTFRRMNGEDPLAALNQELYAASEAIPHDPLAVGDDPMGILDEEQVGAPLGVTLGEWLAASGTATYTVDDDTAMLSISVRDLVPNATYSIWCSRIDFPTAEIIDEPCGEADGSTNSFYTDEFGNAEHTLDLDVLPESTAETINAFALAYHSDGNTYGALPGDFGYNSHVHIVAFLMAAE